MTEAIRTSFGRIFAEFWVELAVLALATVDAEKTGASAQTANSVNPNF